jgi:hypothetical protein
MAEEKTKIVRVPQRVEAVAPTKEEKANRDQAYIDSCAKVEMIDSVFDMTDPMNPKQVGKTHFLHFDSIQGWRSFLINRFMLRSQLVKVVSLPKGWPTLEDFGKEQAKLIEKRDAEIAQNAKDTIL